MSLNHCCLKDNNKTMTSSGYQSFQTISTIELFEIGSATVLSIFIFIALKTFYDKVRLDSSHVTVCIVGAGPVGLISAIIARKCSFVRRVVVYEKEKSFDVYNRSYQIGLDVKSIHFLKKLGVDFDNIEGCWKDGHFFTRVGVFIEYLVTLLKGQKGTAEVKFNTDFSKEHVREWESFPSRVITILCDGMKNSSAGLFGLNDPGQTYPCRAFGAIATFELPNTCLVPIAEHRVHNITFNLSAFKKHRNSYPGTEGSKGFHLKLFGSNQRRFLTLAVPVANAKTLSSLKSIYDRSVMRNIFQVCFNQFRSPEEQEMSDLAALRHLRFSTQLFEIKLTQKRDSVCYFEEGDMFVVVEGEALRSLNIYTGMDVNLSIQGLFSLNKFLYLSSVAVTKSDVTKALCFKLTRDERLAESMARNCLEEYLFCG